MVWNDVYHLPTALVEVGLLQESRTVKVTCGLTLVVGVELDGWKPPCPWISQHREESCACVPYPVHIHRLCFICKPMEQFCLFSSFSFVFSSTCGRKIDSDILLNIATQELADRISRWRHEIQPFFVCIFDGASTSRVIYCALPLKQIRLNKCRLLSCDAKGMMIPLEWVHKYFRHYWRHYEDCFPELQDFRIIFLSGCPWVTRRRSQVKHFALAS